MSSSAIAITKEKLLRRPSLINAREAAIRLVSEREKCKRIQAIHQIDTLRSAGAIVGIFREVMPQEYTRASKQTPSRSRLAAKFFSLIDFPISVDYLMNETAMGVDPLDLGIPIVPCNPHVCENCCPFNEMRLVYQLGLVLGRNYYPDLYEDEEDPVEDVTLDRWWENWRRNHKLPDTLKPVRRALDPDVFFDTFVNARSPLKYLPAVVAIGEYRTGSIFLDFSVEDGEPDIEWSAENVISLRQEWHLAQRLLREVDRLDAWLKREPAKRIAQALRLYHKARKLSDEKRKRAPRAGRVLVGVL